MSKPFVGDVFSLAKANVYFRKELVTVEGSQVTLMSIPAMSDVGEEVHHDVDQTLIFVEGTGKAVLEGVASPIEHGTMVVVPKGTRHNFVNDGSVDLKIISVYAPPRHKVGTIHKTKEEGESDEEHY